MGTYADQPAVRTIARLVAGFVPVSGFFDDAAVARIHRHQAERARAFLDELAKGSILLTEEVIESDDLLHALAVMVPCVLRAHRLARARRFGQLLLGGIDQGKLGGDELDRFTETLDWLTDTDLAILDMLRRLEDSWVLDTSRFKDSEETSDPRTTRYQWGRNQQLWGTFQAEVHARLSIDSSQLNAILARLNGSGLYHIPGVSIYGYFGSIGITTSLLSDLITLFQATGGIAADEGLANFKSDD
jgi:hypothetical protein